LRCHNVADLNAPASLCSSAALLWLLPLLVLATLFFYPLLLIGEQALRDTEGHLGLETFWQVVESRRFLSALLNTLQIAVIATSAACCSAACWR
jgi:ABC-type sulfate transport system permease component